MATAGKKLVKGQGGYRMIPLEDTDTSPFTLQEPPWVPDAQCPTCIQCQGKFDFLNRRHHCRRCGRCFCNACCSTKVHLHRMLFVDPVRHCAGCSSISKKEQDFFERHIRILNAGGTFSVSLQGEDNDKGTVFVCKLSQDHRFLHFENDNRRLDDISLPEIDSLQVLSAGPDPDDEDSLTLYAKKANSNILRRSHNKAHSQILELLYSFEIQSRQDVHKKIPECQSSTEDSVGEQQETNPTVPQDAGATTESDLLNQFSDSVPDEVQQCTSRVSDEVQQAGLESERQTQAKSRTKQRLSFGTPLTSTWSLCHGKPPRNSLAKGLAMQYKDSCGETRVIKMFVTTGPNKKIGQTWIASMQKAFKMIYESRGSSTP